MRKELGLALILAAGCASVEAPPPVVENEPAVRNQHERPIVEEDGKRLLWAGEDDDGNIDWFDMTDATVDPVKFQHGIGKDTIASIDDPIFVAADDPLLAARGVTPETPILGVALNGEARAYPVSVMSRHEVVNDRFGGEAFAVLW